MMDSVSGVESTEEIQQLLLETPKVGREGDTLWLLPTCQSSYWSPIG